jgi:hypothetical protein
MNANPSNEELAAINEELAAIAEIAAVQDFIDAQYEPSDDAWF